MPFILDACAMIAFLRDEEGSSSVEELLNKDDICVAHAINMCEVYYDFLRASGDESIARGAIQDLEAVGISTREDMDFNLWSIAGKHKAGGRISLADCFAIALALRVGGTVVTTDHKEFDPIARRGHCPIRFVR
jgi:PIN domain nuclease of toxin-antitoxin system